MRFEREREPGRGELVGDAQLGEDQVEARGNRRGLVQHRYAGAREQRFEPGEQHEAVEVRVPEPIQAL
jgi:hypothetical protein